MLREFAHRFPQTAAHSLRTYSLQECCLELLHKPEEYLNEDAVTTLYLQLLQTALPSAHPSSFHIHPFDISAIGRLGSYSLRQASLPLLLMKQLMTLVQAVEIARTTGINMRDVWTRGQMIRTWSLLLRQCRKMNYVIPAMKPHVHAQVMTSGPLMLDPLEMNTAGLHSEPVAVLDFASLYPSIMIAYNLCYSTMLVCASSVW